MANILNFLNIIAINLSQLGFATVGYIANPSIPGNPGHPVPSIVPPAGTPYYISAIEIGNNIFRLDGFGFIGTILNTVDIVTLVLLIGVGVAGTIFAIVLGVNLARAEDAEKREAAKKRLIWAMVGVGSIVLISVLLRLIMPLMPGWVGMTPLHETWYAAVA